MLSTIWYHLYNLINNHGEVSLLVKFTGFTGKTLGIISCDAYDMTLSGINSVPFIFLMRNCIKS